MFNVCLDNHKASTYRRRAVSPVIATTIILAITVALGLALWGFINSGVGTATVQYSDAITEYGDVVRNHRFVIANVDFKNPSTNDVAFWVYNNGKINATISEAHIILIPKSDSCDDTAPTTLTQEDPFDTNAPFTVVPKTLKKFYFDSGITLASGCTYELTVVSDAGLTQTFVKEVD